MIYGLNKRTGSVFKAVFQTKDGTVMDISCLTILYNYNANTIKIL